MTIAGIPTETKPLPRSVSPTGFFPRNESKSAANWNLGIGARGNHATQEPQPDSGGRNSDYGHFPDRPA